MTVFLGGLFMIPHDVHTEHTESIFQFHFPVQFAILCSCDFGAVHQDGHFVLSHQQQLSFLLVGLWSFSVLSVIPVWSTDFKKGECELVEESFGIVLYFSCWEQIPQKG